MRARTRNPEEELHRAARQGNVDYIQSCHERGVDLNSTSYKNGATPMLVAAEDAQAESIVMLHSLGANINGTNENSETPLFAATLNNHHHIMRLLCDLGADVDFAACDGSTPLDIACSENDGLAIQILREFGAAVSSYSQDEMNSIVKNSDMKEQQY